MSRLPRAATEDPLLPAGLAAACVAFGLTFRGPRARFWQRMTATGLGLGSLALASSPELRQTRPRPRDAVTGVGSAAVLYGVFLVGDRMARRIMPTGDDDIADIYALRTLRPPGEIAARLALVIGPAEELFWRGFVQPRMARRLGRWPGAAAGSAAYGLAHVVTGNVTLVGAASVAGAFWSALAAAGTPMSSLVASHIAWDIWTFLIAPTGPKAENAR
ncbi:MAG: CPBP family intramembrane metalloprotease [Actinomycetota bacterium]|nr:CPBP family intramembrane metalloprotease [Actinomycetota bacterium]